VTWRPCCKCGCGGWLGQCRGQRGEPASDALKDAHRAELEKAWHAGCSNGYGASSLTEVLKRNPYSQQSKEPT
jgi:hypothetical protein